MPKASREPDFIVPRAALMTWAFAYQGPNADKHQYEERKNLQTVRFESTMEGPRKDGKRVLHAIATDGHRLIHVWWDARAEDVLDAPFEIEADAVDLFLKELGGKGFGRGEGFIFRVKIEGVCYALIAEKPDEAPAWVEAGLVKHDRIDFPPWRSVIPNWTKGDSKLPLTFGVDFDYVIEFHRFLKEFGRGTQMIVNVPYPEGDGPLIFAPAVEFHEGEERFEADFLLLDQATAVEYILSPISLPKK